MRAMEPFAKLDLAFHYSENSISTIRESRGSVSQFLIQEMGTFTR